MNAPTPITPDTKVAQLLDAYPELEQVLIDTAPAFAKLRNPVLRRTIARVTTLARAAEMAGIPVRDLVGSLRGAAGLDHGDSEPSSGDDAPAAEEGPAPWVDASRVRWTVDADSLLDAGEEPISEVMMRASSLEENDLGLIRSSFRPAPLIELLQARGFRAAVVRSGESFATFVGRLPTESDGRTR